VEEARPIISSCGPLEHLLQLFFFSLKKMKKRMLMLLERAIVPRNSAIIPLAHQQPGLSPLPLMVCAAAPISSSSTGCSVENKMKHQTTTSKSNSTLNMEWRKKQLDLLTQKFHPHNAAASAATNVLRIEDDEEDDDDGGHRDQNQASCAEAATTRIVQHDDDLQPMWKNMESRVKNRRTRSLEETQGRSGRENVKSTDEEEWLRAGLYNNDTNDTNAKTGKDS
jgi:hypothetical protein